MPGIVLRIPDLAECSRFVGAGFGPGAWRRIDQQRIERFADASDDHQWIHCDAERARRESPHGTTIAHGYLTLALVPSLLAELVEIGGVASAVNVGIDELRFAAPVPSGAQIRLQGTLAGARSIAGKGVRVEFDLRVEVEGARKPALRARVVFAYFGAPPPAED